jgi:hypothetical protein
MCLSCECFVLPGRYLCNGPIPRPDEFDRLWCVNVCDLETSKIKEPWPALGCCARKNVIDNFCLYGILNMYLDYEILLPLY